MKFHALSPMKFHTLWKRESLLWWISSASYVAGIALVVGAGYFFLTYLNSYQQQIEQYRAGFLGNANVPSLRHVVIEPYFETVGFLLILIIPLLSIRLFCEEKDSGFYSFLWSTPVRIHSFVLAKFIGGLSNFGCFLLLVTLPPLYLLAELDGSVAPALFGGMTLFLLTGLYLSLGMALSQMIQGAFSLSVTHFLLLIILYFLPALASDSLGGYGHAIRNLSPALYSQQLVEGFLSSYAIGFFVAGTTACLVFAGMQLFVGRSRER